MKYIINVLQKEKIYKNQVKCEAKTEKDPFVLISSNLHVDNWYFGKETCTHHGFIL